MNEPLHPWPVCTSLLVAEYARFDRGGALSVLGLFDSFSARRFPTDSLTFFVCAQVIAELKDSPASAVLTVEFVGPTGLSIKQHDALIWFSGPHRGSPASAWLVTPFHDITFAEPGLHWLLLKYSGRVLARLPLPVTARTEAGW